MFNILKLLLIWFVKAQILNSTTAEAVSEISCPLLKAPNLLGLFLFSILTLTLKNVKLECVYNGLTNDCQRSQSVGTEANYNCLPYFTQYDVGRRVSEVRCGTDGNWTNFYRLQSFRFVEDCGKRLVNPRPLIIHGKVTNTTSWPWHATIFRFGNNKYDYICGGSLIRNGIILTAAHCVTSRPSEKIPGDPSSYKVVLGTVSSNYSENVQQVGTQIFDVQSIYISENYEPRRDHQADIAIIRLKGVVRYNDYVIPICLPNDYVLDSNALLPGKFCDVVGFGTDESGDVSPILKHSRLQILSIKECFGRLQQTLDPSQFCAGNHDDQQKFTTVCRGDSGGGLVYPAAGLGKYYIHGIVSTGGRRTTNLCDNYGVFTRVFKYIFWIRDTLEKILGEIIHELSSKVKAPYTIRGIFFEGKIIHRRFYDFPRELENHIAHIQFTNVDLDPNVFVSALEYTNNLETLNLSQVRLDRRITKRVQLPYLKAFALDILSSPEVNFANELDSKELIQCVKSLLFFDKDYQPTQVNWDFEHLISLKTNVELTIDQHKLLNINFDLGKIHISKLPNTNEILRYALADPSKFILQDLALNDCNVNLGIIMAHNRTLRSLVLNEVKIHQDAHSLAPTKIIKSCPKLEELRLSNFYEKEKTIQLLDVPRNITHLSLGGGSLVYPNAMQVTPRIDYWFYDYDYDYHYSDFTGFPFLESFTCIRCTLDVNMVSNFHWIFKELRVLVLSELPGVNLKNLVERMEVLDSIYITNPYANPDFIKDMNLDESILDYEAHTEQRGNILLQRNKSSNEKALWSIRSSNLDFWDNEFLFLGAQAFYTSPDDYKFEKRLTPYEQVAVRTGRYTFNGKTENPRKMEALSVIQRYVQNAMKSADISYVEIVPETLLESFLYAHRLESFILSHVRLHGLLERKLRLERVTEFRLHRVSPSDNPADFLHGYVYQDNLDKAGFHSLIPFTTRRHTSPENSNEPPLHFASSEIYTASILMVLDVSYDGCNLFYMNKLKGELILSFGWTDEYLYNVTSSSNSSNSLEYPIKKLALKGEIYPNLTKLIPASVTHLNLHGINGISNDDDLVRLLRSLDLLIDIRLMGSMGPDSEFRRSVDVTDLASSNSTLQYLELYNLRLSHGSSSLDDDTLVSFKQLEFAYFLDCWFDDKIVQDFPYIFPTEKLVLLQKGSDPRVPNLESHEKILLRLLSDYDDYNETGQITHNITWIYTALYSTNSTSRPKSDKLNYVAATNTTVILEMKLAEIGVPLDQDHYFILEKDQTAGKWKWIPRTNATITLPPYINNIESYFPANKWTCACNFGTNPMCQGKLTPY